jgi:hypothetical protein
LAEVRARDEALVVVDRALSEWAVQTSGVLTQATARGTAAVAYADAVVHRLAGKIAATRQLLGSLREVDDRSRLERELTEAERSLDVARSASQRIRSVVERLSTLQRTQLRSAETLVTAARADLAKRGCDLGAYRQGNGGASGRGSTSAVSSTGSGGLLSARGLTDVDVAAADIGSNPILGSFGRGDTTRADYRWAVQTWDEIVGPGVAKGMTRDDFEARDTARDAPPLRRTATVFDMFLGDTDRLRLTRRPDGSLDVTNGRHRLAVAWELGIRSLPAQVFEP